LGTFFQSGFYSILFHGVVLVGISMWPAMTDRSNDFAVDRNISSIEIFCSQQLSESAPIELKSTHDLIQSENYEIAKSEALSSSSLLPNVDPSEAELPKLELAPAPPQSPANIATHSPSDKVLGADSIPADFSENHPPEYPAAAVQLRLEGTTILKLLVGVDGKVKEVSIIQSSGHQVLDDAAIKAVEKWRGKPAQRFGMSISSEEILPIRFRL
jgi:TonB family protein